jgi:hypothetical protein
VNDGLGVVARLGHQAARCRELAGVDLAFEENRGAGPCERVEALLDRPERGVLCDPLILELALRSDRMHERHVALDGLAERTTRRPEQPLGRISRVRCLGDTHVRPLVGALEDAPDDQRGGLAVGIGKQELRLVGREARHEIAGPERG